MARASRSLVAGERSAIQDGYVTQSQPEMALQIGEEKQTWNERYRDNE